MRALVGIGLVVLGSSSCSSESSGVESGRGCTEIGCNAGLHVSVFTGVLEDGDYLFGVTLDGDAYDCAFSVPDDLPSPGNGLPLSCSTELRNSITISRSSCDSAPCPASGPLELSFNPAGFPESVAVRLERDGAVVIEGERSVEYRQIFPNGADCDSGCRAAVVEFVFD